MDIRVLRYFLAVTREESISGAAESLHMTQPTLSRQLMDLEEDREETVNPREPQDHPHRGRDAAAKAGN